MDVHKYAIGHYGNTCWLAAWLQAVIRPMLSDQYNGIPVDDETKKDEMYKYTQKILKNEGDQKENMMHLIKILRGKEHDKTLQCPHEFWQYKRETGRLWTELHHIDRLTRIQGLDEKEFNNNIHPNHVFITGDDFQTAIDEVFDLRLYTPPIFLLIVCDIPKIRKTYDTLTIRDYRYILVGLVLHHQSRCHYTAIAKIGPDWYEFDCVAPKSQKPIVQKLADLPDKGTIKFALYFSQSKHNEHILAPRPQPALPLQELLNAKSIIPAPAPPKGTGGHPASQAALAHSKATPTSVAGDPAVLAATGSNPELSTLIAQYRQDNPNPGQHTGAAHKPYPSIEAANPKHVPSPSTHLTGLGAVSEDMKTNTPVPMTMNRVFAETKHGRLPSDATSPNPEAGFGLNGSIESEYHSKRLSPWHQVPSSSNKKPKVDHSDNTLGDYLSEVNTLAVYSSQAMTAFH